MTCCPTRCPWSRRPTPGRSPRSSTSRCLRYPSTGTDGRGTGLRGAAPAAPPASLAGPAGASSPTWPGRRRSSRSCGRRRGPRRGCWPGKRSPRGDDPRLAVHRAARIGPFRGRAVLHRGAAVPGRRVRFPAGLGRPPGPALRGVPPGAGRIARRPHGGAARRALLRRQADPRPGAAGGRRPLRRPLAGGPVRRRRPVHRAGRERAAQSDRGTGPPHGVAALRPVRGGPRNDDQVALPGGDAAGALVRGGAAPC